jgi:SAM-dependent methyltransferase
MSAINSFKGVQYLSPQKRDDHFEALYLKVRQQEHRLLDDATVARLPNIGKDHPKHKEWQARAASFKRFQRMMNATKRPLEILEVGCGNGWGCAALARNPLLHVSGVDVNAHELEQAARLFQKPNLQFYYGDIFEDIFPAGSFDIILLNAAVQYFPDFAGLIRRLFYFLKDDGAIHIRDTPFYEDDEIAAAKARTEDYYKSMGVAALSEHYFHHRRAELEQFHTEILSQGGGLMYKIQSLFRPSLPANFIWARICK